MFGSVSAKSVRPPCPRFALCCCASCASIWQRSWTDQHQSNMQKMHTLSELQGPQQTSAANGVQL